MADETKHSDIRWNPELLEWFCAKCGLASDHSVKEDALVELEASECSLVGTEVKRLRKEQRKFRAKQLGNRDPGK